MDLNTNQAKESVAQLASLFSDEIVRLIEAEETATLGSLEQGMRQLLQEVGRQALAEVLGKTI